MMRVCVAVILSLLLTDGLAARFNEIKVCLFRERSSVADVPMADVVVKDCLVLMGAVFLDACRTYNRSFGSTYE